MARFSWLWVAALASTMVACSGGRQEDLSCDDVSQCSDGQQCIDGLCQTTDSVMLSASAVSAGASIPVLIIDGAGNSCEAQKCTNLPYGSQVTFRAGSDPGYRFTNWSGTPECKGTNVDLVIPSLQQSVNCIANYVKRVKVTAHTSGGEGGVTASSDSPFAVCNGGVCEVDAGSPVKLRADDRFGQRFTGWSGAGCGSATTFETTVTAAGDLMCVANFVERIVVSAEAMNAETDILVSSDGAVCEPGSCILDKGGNATLTAPEVPKFRFAGWSGSAGCVGSDRVLRFSALQKSESCLATYTPRVTVSGSSSGAEPPPAITALSSDLYAACNGGSCDTDVGGGVTLLAGSTEGYRLTGWSGPKCEAETGAAVTLSEVTEDAQCVANYLQGIAVIGAVVGAPGEVTATSTNPAAVCAEGGCVIDIGADVTLTAPSPAGYRFLGWDGDEGCTSSAATVAFTAVTSSRTCYARFAARYLVRGTVIPQAGGTVAATSSAPGAVCENDNCTLDGGGEVTLTVTTRENYRFSGWSGGGACTGTEPTVRIANVQGNTTCQANFVGRFTVAGIAAQPAGGSVVATSDSGAAACTGATCQVDRGSRVSLTATAAEGFRFVSWSGCSSANGATITLEGIAADATCTASFTPLRYTVDSSVAPADSGTVAVTAGAGNPQCGNGQCTVDWGTTVSLTAAPAVGWRFGGWSGCTTSDQATITLPNVRANATCQARFQRITFVVTADGTPDNGGSVAITASGPGATCTGLRCTVPYGGGAALTATPATGWNFGGWSGCSTSMNTALALANVTGNADCVANFTRQRFNVVGNTRPAEGGTVAATSAAQGAVCNGNGCAVNYGSAVTLRAAANTGWRFLNWSGCQTSNAAEINVTNVTANTTCVASFERLRFTVTGAPGAGGAVTAASQGGDCAGGACTVNFGASVALVAMPSAGFRFLGWMGCGITGGAAIEVPNVTANVTCAAAFERLTFTVVGSAAPAAGGAVTVAAMNDAACTGSSCVVNYGGAVTYAAAPAAGYNLTSWTGCTALAADATRALIGPVTSPGTCVANFTLRSYRVVGESATGGSISAATSTNGTCTGATCTVNHGGSATFTVAPEAGYTFGGWTGCTANAQNPLQATVANVTGAATCRASFTRVRVTVSGISSGNGVVLASSQGGTCDGNACEVNYGASVTLMAMPITGFRFSGWTACPVTGGAAITLANVMAATSCTANFERINFTVVGNASPAAGGTVSVVDAGSGTCTGTNCVVPFGGSVTFATEANASHEFVGWTGGCTALPNAPTRAAVANVTANATCTASYRARRYVVTGGIGEEGGGTISAASANPGTCTGASCTVDHGGSVTFTATTTSGYAFRSWTGACTQSASNPLVATATNVTEGGSCTANFAMIRYTVSAASSFPQITTVSASPLNGNPCGSASCTVPAGTVVTLTASIYQYSGRLRDWTCSDGITRTGTSINVAANADIRCTANFVEFVSVIVRPEVFATGASGGTTAMSGLPAGAQCSGTNNCWFDRGATISVTATPMAGYLFYGWAPATETSNCPLVGMPASTRLTADTAVACEAQFYVELQ